MKVFFYRRAFNRLVEHPDPSVVPHSSRRPGEAREKTGCEIHRVVKRSDVTQAVTPAARQLWRIPGPLTHAFLDEDGEPMCALCVAEGIRTGAHDIVNPDELQLSPDPCFPEPDGVDEVRAALPYWGLDSLDVIFRAVEAARRHDRIEELYELLFAGIRDESQVSSTSDSPSSPSRRFRGGKQRTGPRQAPVL